MQVRPGQLLHGLHALQVLVRGLGDTLAPNECPTELLRDSNEKVAAIAARVGYESVPSFSRAFKRWQHESPATYRRTA
ncbi:MAG: helix-turn-helix domain-containing protein [Polyangiales bacterium]